MSVDKIQARAYASQILDDSGNVHDDFTMLQPNARHIGWQCGLEPYFIVVQSYLGVRLDDEDAVELARDYLLERNWSADPEAENKPDYVL